MLGRRNFGPRKVINTPLEDFHGCGISRAKTKALNLAAEVFLNFNFRRGLEPMISCVSDWEAFGVLVHGPVISSASSF
jgi:hypothetical protein